MYIIIKTHGGAEYAAIVTDFEGNNKVFDNMEDAHSPRRTIASPV
ncbi:hypothetical protein [Mucilaginibacter rubeus]|nr:hypothetical protein [Mucilaginibacter rubeus]